ncbi:hypothetical protein [Comamonas guangdongensis]|uniref:Uncharacterized protein n=1 Tax=Comamonas guangdongensis TaxID=510515 RepID=A0ABV3ZPS8_9BURK
MSNAKHTSAPWEFRSESGYCSQIDGADGTVICCFDEDPNQHDSRLIAAAPELLEALQGMLAYWLAMAPGTRCDEIDNATAAIAKATA